MSSKTAELSKACEKQFKLEQELAFYKLDAKFEHLGILPPPDDMDVSWPLERKYNNIEKLHLKKRENNFQLLTKKKNYCLFSSKMEKKMKVHTLERPDLNPTNSPGNPILMVVSNMLM